MEIVKIIIVIMLLGGVSLVGLFSLLLSLGIGSEISVKKVVKQFDIQPQDHLKKICLGDKLCDPCGYFEMIEECKKCGKIL